MCLVDKRINSTIEDLLYRFPGYSGYRDKEDRRDDDRRVREVIAATLDTIVTGLTRMSATLAEQRKLTQISAVERIVGTTRHLADRVRTASYGYGGIFTERSVDEHALEQLRQFDVRFQKEVEALGELGKRIAASPEGPLDADLNAYQDELNRLGQLFDARSEVIESAKPNRDAAVLALLETNPPSKAAALESLKRGDALSIAGENFIVDATVIFSEPGGTVRLSRVGTDHAGAGVWLLAGTVAGIEPARLVEGGTSPPSGEPRPAEVEVDADGGTREGVGARYAYTAGTGGISFWYAIGGETRSFQGESLADDDIVIYGQA
jgi:hypothetical protein